MSYYLLALIAMVGVGTHMFLVKIISPHISSLTIIIASCIVSIPIVFVYMHFAKIPFMPEQKIYLGYAFLISVPAAIGLIALYLAIIKGPLSVIMPIYGLYVVIVALLGILVLHEPFSIARGVGLALAMAAIVLLGR